MERILVVDDNAPLCWLIERMLRGKYLVTVMNDGLEALAWLHEGTPCDLIITDLNMPSMTGFELLQSVKQSGLFREIPVIILSGDTGKINDCLEAGASACFTKPFDPQSLIREIRSIFNAQKAKAIAI